MMLLQLQIDDLLLVVLDLKNAPFGGRRILRRGTARRPCRRGHPFVLTGRRVNSHRGNAAYGGGACLDVSAGANHKRSVQTGPDRPTWFYIRNILTLDAGESKTGGGLDYECALDPRADPGLVAVRDLDRCEGAGGVAGVSTHRRRTAGAVL